MTAKVIIPVFHFTKILEKIIAFYREHLDDAIIIIMNDGVEHTLDYLNNDNVIVIDNIIHNDLSWAFLYADSNGITDSTDVIITNEHDVMPSAEALYAGLEVYLHMRHMMNVASVSFIYQWKGVNCYPTHEAWITKYDSLVDDSAYGTISIVGSQGVPFGCAIWNPDAFKHLSTEGLPTVKSLDSQFGALLYALGYTQLRMLNYTVEHYNGGVKSWRFKPVV